MLPRATHTRSPREAAVGRQGGRTQEIQRLIGRSLRSVTELRGLGERTITLDCDVLQADGGTRCAAITGACVALAIALAKLVRERAIPRWPLRETVAATSVGICAGQVVLDLAYVEDSEADVDCNVVGTASGAVRRGAGNGRAAAVLGGEADASCSRSRGAGARRSLRAVQDTRLLAPAPGRHRPRRLGAREVAPRRPVAGLLRPADTRRCLGRRGLYRSVDGRSSGGFAALACRFLERGTPARKTESSSGRGTASRYEKPSLPDACPVIAVGAVLEPERRRVCRVARPRPRRPGSVSVGAACAAWHRASGRGSGSATRPAHPGDIGFALHARERRPAGGPSGDGTGDR